MKIMKDIKPIAISLFAGAGGCSLGFKNAGYKILYASDIDKSAIETYNINFPETFTECKDIRNVDFHNILSTLNIHAGEVDIVIGGPPCQGFSTAGARSEDDPRNGLLRQYVQALDIIKPKWFLMENVEGLLTAKKGEYIRETIIALTKLGYTVRLEKVYSHDYGIPQKRKRVIIIGNRFGQVFKFPKPQGQMVTISQALTGLPSPSYENISLPYEIDFSNSWAKILKSPTGIVTDHFTQTLTGIQYDRVKELKQGQTMKNLPDYMQHPSFSKRAARRVKDGMPTEKRGGAPSGLKRLKENEPSLTITSAAIREFIHPTENRYLTIRECARIQTFPDDFIFCGCTGDKIQQIGNAIPPLLAEIFARHIYSIKSNQSVKLNTGSLLDFVLTKSNGLSPALKETEKQLTELILMNNKQYNIFDNGY